MTSRPLALSALCVALGIVGVMGCASRKTSGAQDGVPKAAQLANNDYEKARALCLDAAADYKNLDTRQAALRKYQEALSITHTSELVYEIHEKILTTLRGSRWSPEARKLIKSVGAKKALAHFGGQAAFELSGLVEIEAELDASLLHNDPESPEALAGLVTKGYIYLCDQYEPPRLERVKKATRIFENIAARDHPAWKLNGLIGLAMSRRGYSAYKPGGGSPPGQTVVYRQIIKEFPSTILAAIAQGAIAQTYSIKKDRAKALRETRKLLEYPNFEIERFGEPTHPGILWLKKGKNTLHEVARGRIEKLETPKWEPR